MLGVRYSNVYNLSNIITCVTIVMEGQMIKKRITFEVLEEFHKEIRIQAAREGLSIRMLVETILKEYLKRKK